MPVFIDSDTGFPSEIPCPGCGWPLYCCLCERNDEEPSTIDHIVAINMPTPKKIVTLPGPALYPTVKELTDGVYGEGPKGES